MRGIMLAQWTKNGPGQTVAFVLAPEPDELAELLVAFANSDGGTVLIGIDEEGQVDQGLIFEEIEDILRLALAQCRPGVSTEWQRAAIEDSEVVALR
ncbi:MAG: helix-turn-helix domain-containing protein, partial [Anaerolineae bacterium]